jgi:type II secretory pathway pseudopilin PulG
MMQASSNKGFSLIETVIALGVLVTGVLGAAGVLAAGMKNLSTSPSNVIVAQKATEAIEAVFAARDSHRLTWAQIKNVANGGVFLDGPQSLKIAGPDGLVNTADDLGIETIILPGRTVTLTGYTREILIEDVAGESGQLRKITVTIRYSGQILPYILRTFISTYA